MPISENIAEFLKRYKQAHHLSIAEFAKELGISKNSMECYLNGSGKPRTDSLEQLAERLGVTVAEMISDPLPGLEQAEIIFSAGRAAAALPPGRREKVLQHFHELVELFAEGDQS